MTELKNQRMAGIVEQIFPLGDASKVLADECSTRMSHTPSTFILGPAISNRSALLMQAAVSESAADGQVLYITPHKFEGLPPTVHGMPQPSSSILENIRFLYAQKEREMTSYLASLHMISAENRPTLIIIDDLQFYSYRENIDAASQLVNAARIISLAQESAEFCTKSPEYRSPYQCGVVVSWTLGPGSGPLRKEEVESMATMLCHHVWFLYRKVKKTTDSEEYHLLQEGSGHRFVIEFFFRVSPSPHFLFHQVIMKEIKAGGGAATSTSEKGTK